MTEKEIQMTAPNMEARDELLIFGLMPTSRDTCIPEYVKYDRLFSPPECKELISLGDDWGPSAVGDVNGGFKVDTNYRSVSSCNLYADKAAWFYRKLLQHIKWTNDAQFHFSLSGMNEFGQLLHYEMPHDDMPAGHYKWHQDYGSGYMSLRKLSVVVQLSDPADYDGCRLTLQTYRQFEVPENKQGDVIIFPSYLPHMVTSITRGHRYALALWISGPPFV